MADNDDDLMDPKASPQKLTHRVGVRRLNGRPLWLLLIVVLGFLGVMAKTAMDRSEEQKIRARTNEIQGGDSTMFARNVAGMGNEGYIAPTPLPPPVVPISKEELEIPPPPPNLGPGGATQRPPPDNDAEKIRGIKVAAMLSAVRAPTNGKAASLDPQERMRSGAARQQPVQLAQGQMPQLPQMMQQPRTGAPNAASLRAAGPSANALDPMQILDPNMGAGAGPDPSSYDSRSNIDQWDNVTPGRDRWRLRSSVRAPRTDYEIAAGTVIPAILVTAINSDLAGPITAQVSQNVSDTAIGRELLIPQGSMLFGRYSNEIAFGQSRVLVAWQRIRFPDGKTIDIGSMPGSAEDGTAGFADRVNNHYLRLFGNALFLSAVTGGVALSQRNSTGALQAPTAGDVMSQQLGVALGQTLVQVIRKNLNVSPTIEIRPGFRFNVIATKDITFNRAYQAFDYKRGARDDAAEIQAR